MLVVQRILGNKKTTENSSNLVSPVGVSLAGALGNIVAQLLLARFILFGEGTRYISPIMLIIGAVTGLLLGLFAKRFMNKSLWFQKVEAY